jgi:hypothetical protein
LHIGALGGLPKIFCAETDALMHIKLLPVVPTVRSVQKNFYDCEFADEMMR